MQRFKQLVGEYFGSAGTLSDEPLPEVRKALFEDAPKVVRLTIWSLVGFFLFALLWASFAVVDEVTRGDGKVIPSSKLQKVQNLEGGIVKKLFVHEGQVVNIGDPLIQLDDTRFSSNVGETEADRQALMLRGRGHTREHIVCPIHRWTYALDGQLVGAPHFAADPCLHLNTYPLHRWQGLLFDDRGRDVRSALRDCSVTAALDFSGHVLPINWLP